MLKAKTQTQMRNREKPGFTDRAERIKWCPHREYQIPLLCCPRCARFPCRGMTAHDMDDLENSLFTEQRFAGLTAGRTKMYIFRYSDGRLEKAPDTFSPDNIENMATKAALDDVDEIYVVSKTLVKQVKLVVKTKEEIAVIRDALSPATGKKK